MKKFLQRLAIWFYEKMDCRSMDKGEFWHQHVYYAVPKGTDPLMIISEINRINGNLDLVGTWQKEIGFTAHDGQD